jgi:hypothetical protein
MDDLHRAPVKCAHGGVAILGSLPLRPVFEVFLRTGAKDLLQLRCIRADRPHRAAAVLRDVVV